MNIVHVEDFFHPLAGYQINIIPKYMVKQGHEVTIVTSEMDKIPDYLTSFFGTDDIEKHDKDYMNTTGVKIIRLPLKSFISGRAVFSNTLFKSVDELNPDVLYVHGNDTLTGIRFLLRRKKLKYALVMDSHMLEMASKNKFSSLFRLFYKKFITPIIINNQIKVIRTQDDPYVEKCLGIPLNLCPWISVGSDTLLFKANSDVKKKFRNKHNIDHDDFVVIYTGKLDESKGAMLLANTFKKKFLTDRKVVLIVVGNSKGEYGETLERVFDESENMIIRVPTQKYIDLPYYYQAADLSVFPKQCSLSFYDAQASGLPVISENNTINKNRLLFSNGEVFNSGDISDFRGKIQKYVNLDPDCFAELKQNATNYVKDNFDYEKICFQYTDILLKEVQRFGTERQKK